MMNAPSLLISQVIGLYLFLIAIILIARAKYYRELLEDIRADNIEVFFTASFWLLLGILLVVVHNIWVMKPIVVITILSWLILIKAIFWLFMPEVMLRAAKKLYFGAGYYIITGIAAFLGLLLIAQGFSPYYYHFLNWGFFN